jgi:hypothetical protein
MKLLNFMSIVLIMSVFIWGGVAFAATYNLTISGAHTGNIVLTAGDPGSESDVTDASGTFDGHTVTGIKPVGICYADNKINAAGVLGHVKNGGITLKYNSGVGWFNVYNSPGYGFVNKVDFCDSTPTVSVSSSFSVLSATPVPTFSSWAMILSAGLLGLFAIIKLRRSRPTAA